MICHACGKENEDADKFCYECGTSLASGGSASGGHTPHATHAPDTEVVREPDTLSSLIGLQFKNAARGLKRNLKTLILAAVVALVTVYGLQLVLAANVLGETVASSPLPLFLNQLVALEGQTARSSIIWFLLPVFGGAIYAQIRSLGLEGYLQRVRGLAGSLRGAVRGVGSRGIGLMLASAALAVAVAALTGNIKVIEAAVAVLSFNAVLAGAQSALVLGLQLAHRDWTRKGLTAPLIKPDYPLLAVTGVSLGFVVSIFLADATALFLIAVALGIIGVGLIFFSRRSVAHEVTASRSVGVNDEQ
jgi:hypothetical protein